MSKPTVILNLIQAFAAVVLGNVAYFLLEPALPPVAQHHPPHVDLGMIVDFWFCLVALGIIRTARKWR